MIAPGRRRGFALLLAIATLALVSTALLVLTRNFALEVQRTHSTWQDAQLRQFLLAGATDVSQRARGWGERIETQSWRLTLPADSTLSDAGVSLRTIQKSDADLSVEIDARIENRRASERLYLRQTDGLWTVTGAELIQ